MRQIFSISAGDGGTGRIEFHRDDRPEIEQVFGEFGLVLSDGRFAGWGTSTTKYADFTATADKIDLEIRVVEAMRERGYSIGVL